MCDGVMRLGVPPPAVPVEVLPRGDSQGAAVPPRAQQHVATVWVALQKDLRLCTRHGAEAPAHTETQRHTDTHTHTHTYTHTQY